MSEPAIPPTPQAPSLASQLPDGITITAEDVEIYRDACEAWDDDEYTEEEILREFGLSRSSACDWAITGYTIQGGLTVESIYNQQANYAEQLRSYIDFLRKTIENMYKISLKTTAKMQE